MGKRSNKRIFRRRRQRAGFAVLAVLVVVTLGGLVGLTAGLPSIGIDRAQNAEREPVDRVNTPESAEAPEAVADADAGGAEKVLAAEEEDKKTAAEKEVARERAEAADKPEEPKEDKEQAAAKPPAQPPVPKTNDLWLDVPKLGLYDNYVANSNSLAALDAGAAKMVETGWPWQDNANTYISAHRLGWPGTASDHQFYNLPLLEYGDKIYLTDAKGTTYTYEVTEIYEVLPSETWITAPQVGRDMVSLQTCIEDYGDYWTMGPNWYVRYVVRADRVDWQRA